MLTDFLSPIALNEEYLPHQIGAQLERYGNDFPDLEGKQLAIIGVQDGRGSGDNAGTRTAPDAIRKQFYALSQRPGLMEDLVDLGDIRAGERMEDTEAALRQLLQELNDMGILCIVIGGSAQFGYAMYQAMDGQSNNIDLTIVSRRLPIMEGEVLARICAHEPNYLFNINALGFQSHYVPNQAQDIMNRLHFNQLRLGELKASPAEAEPLIRNTDLFLMDMAAIKFSESPGLADGSPNGIEGDLACKLCWYAGVSDLTLNFGLFEMNPEFDVRDQSAKLAAQMIWYFTDGYSKRVNDHPGQHSDFLRYRCTFEERQPELIFHKSKRSSRWWMEVPNPKSLNNSDMNVIVPCSYRDYQEAAQGEIPDRYLHTIQKMH